MCKVFLQHLQALCSRASFGALWARVLRVQRSLLAAPQEPLREAALESLKNMLLVMHSVRIFNSGDSYNDLWYITWEIIGEFLPTLKDELFPKVHDNMRPAANLPSHMQPPLPSSLPTLLPVSPAAPALLPVPPSPPSTNQVVPKANPSTPVPTPHPVHIPTLTQPQNILVASIDSPVNLNQTPPSMSTPSLVAPTPVKIANVPSLSTPSSVVAPPTATSPQLPLSGMVPIRNPLYDQSGLASSVLLQPLNEMISTPIGISIQTQPPVLYKRPADPPQNDHRSDAHQNEPKPIELESKPAKTNADTVTTRDAQQSELYAEYLSNPYNEAKEISMKEATLYDPDENRRDPGANDQTVPEPKPLHTHPLPSQKSFSANVTPMHAKSKAQFSSSENMRQESSIFNFSSYFGSANDLVIPGSEVFDTLMSSQEG